MAASQKDWLLSYQELQKLSETTNLAELLVRCQAAMPETQEGLMQAVTLAVKILEVGDFQTCWEVAKLFPRLGTAALRQAHGERMVAPLIAMLEDEEADPEQRWFVARILGAFEQDVVVTALINLLQTAESEELRGSAMEALAQLGEGAIAPLINLLDCPACRLSVVRTLAQIHHPDIISALLGVVQDSEVAVRAAAIAALSQFHDSCIVPVLAKALDDPFAAVRQEAVIGLSLRAIGNQDTEVDLVACLQPRLWDANTQVCQQAAIGLGRVGTDAAVRALVAVLQPAAPPMMLQLEAIRSLGWIGTVAALDALQQGLDQALGRTEKDYLASLTLCQEIVLVLGRMEQPALMDWASQILLDLLHSDCAVVQETRLKQTLTLSLGQLGQERSLAPLIQLLADADAGVRFHAIAALKHLNHQAVRQSLKQITTDERSPLALKKGAEIALSEWFEKIPPGLP